MYFTAQEYTEPMLSHINVGAGVDCSIRELAETMVRVIGFERTLIFDTSKPDGTIRKLMNVDRLADLVWKIQVQFKLKWLRFSLAVI